jgi:hypothetical protein
MNQNKIKLIDSKLDQLHLGTKWIRSMTKANALDYMASLNSRKAEYDLASGQGGWNTLAKNTDNAPALQKLVNRYNMFTTNRSRVSGGGTSKTPYQRAFILLKANGFTPTQRAKLIALLQK